MTVVDEAFTVERDDVLAVVRRPRGVDVGERPLQLRQVSADDLVAGVTLARAEWRRIDVEEHVRSLCNQLRQRLDRVELVPQVFADRDAEPDRSTADRDRYRLTDGRRREKPLVVEISIAWQQGFVRALQHAAVAQDAGGVELQNRAAFVARRRIEIDEPDDGGD